MASKNPLVEAWNLQHEYILSLSLAEVLVFGRYLKDGLSGTVEFREYLDNLEPDQIAKYMHECIHEKFDKSGMALQDIVNVIGDKLGFSVTFGRYYGSSKEAAYDGLWRGPDGHAIVVESKTTGGFNIDFGKLEKYRQWLIKEGEIESHSSSILVVVGKMDTEAWEAQIVGQGFSRLIRIISADALARLLRIKVQYIDDESLLEQIRLILKPQEYIKLDGIIDLVLAAYQESDEPEKQSEDLGNGGEQPPEAKPVSYYEDVVPRLENALGVKLVQESKTFYRSSSDEVRLQLTISKMYGSPGDSGYWYAFHPRQQEKLKSCDKPYLALGCGSPQRVLLIPYSDLEPWLGRFNTTTLKDGKMYWHLQVKEVNGQYSFTTKQTEENIELTHYLI